MRKPKQTTWMVMAAILLCLLPCIAVGAGLGARAIIADSATIPNEAAVEYLANKSIAYWLLTLAGISITSWTWIFKWLINQLELQRQAHTAATQQLIDFMKTDHTATTAMLATSQSVLATTQQALTALTIRKEN